MGFNSKQTLSVMDMKFKKLQQILQKRPIKLHLYKIALILSRLKQIHFSAPWIQRVNLEFDKSNS